MKTTLECIPCLVRQALQTARMSTKDVDVQTEIVRSCSRYAGTADMSVSPAHFSMDVYRTIAEMSGNPDAFAELKAESNRLALKMLPKIRSMVEASPDRLSAAAHAAVAGNVIDAGVNHGFDIERDLAEVMSLPFGWNDLEQFRSRMKPGASVLYLLDNAGEIVFDRLLIEELFAAGLKVTAVVKSGPILNDVLMADAEAAGLTDVCEVIESGAAVVGVDWRKNPSAFRRRFDAADLVIAKGHGHFETLDTESHPGLFCLLKSKCMLVSEMTGVNLGDLLFIRIATMYQRIGEKNK